MYSNKVLGHKKTINHLKTLFLSKRIPPTLIFNGPEGIGKAIAAKEFAKSINCAHDAPHKEETAPGLFRAETEKKEEITDPAKPCQTCVSCSQIEKGVHPDVRIIDAAFQGFLRKEDEKKQKKLKIETVREFSKYAYTNPLLSENKVFIINDANTLTIESQNAMLKLLEEPPKNTFFILISSQKNAFLSTVLSRSHIIEFGPLSKEDVEEILARNNIPLNDAALLSGYSGGSVKKAMNIKNIMEKFKKFDTNTPACAFKISSMLPKESYQAREDARMILNIFLTNAHHKWTRAANPAQKKECGNLVRQILKFKKFLNQNVMPAPILESAALECLKCQVKLNFR